MSQVTSLSLVIPVYNEEESLLPLFNESKRVCDDLGHPWEIIFVDDGSQDKSTQVLKDLAQQHKEVKCIFFRRNFGQTSAMSAGFHYAKGSTIITMDADLQNDPKDIPGLLKKLNEGFDIVSGWRHQRKDSGLSRKLPSWLANRLISKVTGVHLHDYGCTLKAYSKEVLDQIHLYGEMHRFIPAVASGIGAKVTEIKVAHRYRQFGTSKYNLSRTPRVILDLILVKFILSYMSKPIQIFGKFGLYSMTLSVLTLGITCYMKLFHDIDMTGNPLLYLALLFVIIGIQFISLGLLGEMNARIYYEGAKHPTYTVKETYNLT